MNRNNPEFKKLKKEWYDRLEEAGFKDIEQDEDNLKVWTTTKINSIIYGRNKSKYNIQTTLSRIEDKKAYYDLATQFLNDYQFTDKTLKIIWALHAEGSSHREISLALASHGIKKSRQRVLDAIHDLRDKMMRKYATTPSK